jgi:hypothetical protein
MIQFANKNMNIGTIAELSKTIVAFDFMGDPKEIVHVEPGCHCTANCKIEGNSVVAEYTDTDKPARDKEANLKTHFPSGLWPFTKEIIVYLNDGKDLKVLDENGLVFNKDKEQIVLKFHGQVRFS